MDIICFRRIVAGSLLLASVGCANPLNSAGPGWVFTEVTEAVSANNGVPSNKKGEACGQNILGIVSTGDSTVQTAKRNGAINQVASIDRSFFSILGVYAKACTVIWGN